MEKKTLPPRSDVPLHETWDLASIFPDIESWEAAKDEVMTKIP